MAREKKVYTDDAMIGHLWAHQTTNHARNPRNTFYFWKDKIYSYGSHFEIARMLKFDPDKPSNCVVLFKEYITKNKSPKLHVNSKAVDMYDKQNNFIRSFISASEAAFYIKSTSGNILKCCRNTKGYKTIKGYIFKFKNKENENFE